MFWCQSTSLPTGAVEQEGGRLQVHHYSTPHLLLRHPHRALPITRHPSLTPLPGPTPPWRWIARTSCQFLLISARKLELVAMETATVRGEEGGLPHCWTCVCMFLCVCVRVCMNETEVAATSMWSNLNKLCLCKHGQIMRRRTRADIWLPFYIYCSSCFPNRAKCKIKKKKKV